MRINLTFEQNNPFSFKENKFQNKGTIYFYLVDLSYLFTINILI